MPYVLKLGDSARLVFKNAINESQALAQLRSAFPQMTRGVLKEKGWRELSEAEIVEIVDQNREAEVTFVNGKAHIRDESKDVYHEPEIELQENK
jgi:hypothetical protein